MEEGSASILLLYSIFTWILCTAQTYAVSMGCDCKAEDVLRQDKRTSEPYLLTHSFSKTLP